MKKNQQKDAQENQSRKWAIMQQRARQSTQTSQILDQKSFMLRGATFGISLVSLFFCSER